MKLLWLSRASVLPVQAIELRHLYGQDAEIIEQPAADIERALYHIARLSPDVVVTTSGRLSDALLAAEVPHLLTEMMSVSPDVPDRNCQAQAGSKPGWKEHMRFREVRA